MSKITKAALAAASITVGVYAVRALWKNVFPADTDMNISDSTIDNEFHGLVMQDITEADMAKLMDPESF